MIFFSFAYAFCLWLPLGVWWCDALLYIIENDKQNSRSCPQQVGIKEAYHALKGHTNEMDF
jgi:hypothetical protein